MYQLTRDEREALLRLHDAIAEIAMLFPKGDDLAQDTIRSLAVAAIEARVLLERSPGYVA